MTETLTGMPRQLWGGREWYRVQPTHKSVNVWHVAGYICGQFYQDSPIIAAGVFVRQPKHVCKQCLKGLKARGLV